jgi:hypothetical protein
LARAVFAIVVASTNSELSSADEGGVSFWLPGLFGSFAAVPGTPGVSAAVFYYHSSVSAGAGKAFQQGGRFEVGIAGRGDVIGFGPTYTFATPVLGGQASLSLVGVGGHELASVSGTLTGPNGAEISGSRSQSLTAFGDLFPQATLKWNQGASNYMVYATGDIPVGSYDPNRLVNLGIGHGAFDAGGGYTYFDPAKGLEFSAVVGLAYNFENSHTDYQNGLDAHLDVGASYFLNKQLFIGAVGYVFDQISGDSGTGAKLGSFESQVAGVGPQIGYFFPVNADIAGFINVKAYREFAAQNRPDGWNAWVTLAFSPAEHQK